MIEVLKQALEALENSQRFVEASANAKMLHGWGEQLDTAEDAIQAGRQAIKELESQEPVGEVSDHDWSTGLLYRDLAPGTPLYTAPPQRTWVGLTDEEVESYWDWEDFQTGAGRLTILKMVRDIEAKLKEKNS